MYLGDNLQTMLYDLENNPIAYQMLYQMRTTQPSIGDFFDYEIGTGMLSFLPKARAVGLDPSQGFQATGRQKAKVGRVVRQIFDDTGRTVSDYELELFSNYLRALDSTLLGEFSLVEGDAILDAYHRDNYMSRQGTLNNSCMKYDECQQYLQVYADNPDIVKLLVMFNKENHKVMGRALVWNTSEGFVMDRIYGSCVTQASFEKYAEMQGWWFKHDMGSFFIKSLKDEDNPTKLDLEVSLERLYDFYPYMDTFQYFDTKANKLYTTQYHGHDVQLTGTDGDDHPGFQDALREQKEFYCEHCGYWWSIEGHNGLCPQCVLCEQCLSYYDGTFQSSCPNCERRNTGTFPISFVPEVTAEPISFYDLYSRYTTYRPDSMVYTMTLTNSNIDELRRLLLQ